MTLHLNPGSMSWVPSAVALLVVPRHICHLPPFTKFASLQLPSIQLLSQLCLSRWRRDTLAFNILHTFLPCWWFYMFSSGLYVTDTSELCRFSRLCEVAWCYLCSVLSLDLPHFDCSF